MAKTERENTQVSSPPYKGSNPLRRGLPSHLHASLVISKVPTSIYHHPGEEVFHVTLRGAQTLSIQQVSALENVIKSHLTLCCDLLTPVP